MLARNTDGGGRNINGGFTLIELMVAVAVLAILAAVAIPSMRWMVNNSRLVSQSNNLVADIQMARSEATRQNRTVSLCRSTDGATCATGTGGWSIWIIKAAAAAEVLRVTTVTSNIQVKGPAAKVDFRADGMARNSTGGLLSAAFTVCIPTTEPAKNLRTVNIAAGSRVKTTQSDNSGACP